MTHCRTLLALSHRHTGNSWQRAGSTIWVVLGRAGPEMSAEFTLHFTTRNLVRTSRTGAVGLDRHGLSQVTKHATLAGSGNFIQKLLHLVISISANYMGI